MAILDLTHHALRGHPPELGWDQTDGVVFGDDRWRSSAEDFAEVFVDWVFEGEYEIASTGVAAEPDQAQLAAFCSLLALDSITCG